MSDLPTGWVQTEVREITDGIEYGFTAKASQVDSGVRYLRITDIQENRVDWNTVPFCAIGESSAERYLLRKGDLVFARTGATTGKSFLIQDCPKSVFASYLIRLRTTKAVFPEFIARYFHSRDYWQQITENIAGSAQPNCNATKLSRIKLSIPPLNEQKRIVEKLEKLFGRVEAVQARLDKIPAILKRFRQSVLAAACSGKLTADWRETNPEIEPFDVNGLRNYRLLGASNSKAEKINSIYDATEENDSDELPATWCFATLNKLCESFDYGTSAKSSKNGKVPVLRMGNLQNGEIDWSDLAFTSDKTEISKYRLRQNSVLFNRTNSPELVGKTAIYRGGRDAIFAGYLIRINNFEILDPEYLNLCLNTSHAKEFCRRVKSDGVSQSNINAQKLGTFEVPFPPLEEQKEIVRRVEELFKFADAVEERYKKVKAHTDKLTQSILAKAFRGELVHQDPNDEPASVLLERIGSK